MFEALLMTLLASGPAPAHLPMTAPAGGELPTALTRKALCDELTRTSEELAAARAKIEADRTELEKLKAEIAQARAGLRAETEKLEGLLATRGVAPLPVVGAPQKTTTAVRHAELDALARTMKSMRPEAAAALVQRSQPALAASLLKRMKPAAAGAVMDRLEPEFAADLLALMSTMPSAPPKPGDRL